MQMTRRFRDMKLSKKMILVYLVFAIISCILSILALQVSFHIYDDELYQKSLQELDYFTQNVNDGLKEIEDLSLDIILDDEIQRKLSNIYELDHNSSEYSYRLYEFRFMLLDKINDIPLVQNIIYTDGNQIRFMMGTDRGDVPEERYENLLQTYNEARGGYCISSPTGDYPYLMSGRDILEREPQITLDYLGSIVITTDVASMIEKEKKNLEATNSYLYVFSDVGTVYRDDTEVLLDTAPIEGEQGYKIVRSNGKRYFQCYLKSSKTGWTYVNMFPYSEVYGRSLTLRYSVVTVFAMLFILMLLAMLKMADIITRPLVRLAESMQIVATGDFKGAKVVIENDTQQDETGMLAREFSMMLDKIYVLIHENYEKQLLLKDTKYRMLQAQINPHFLYNTLNAINWMVKAQRNEDAVKMIVELGSLLRASFADDITITVKEELDVAKSYITIQKYRYGERIDFEVEVEGDIASYTMPGMILQPLIENAIYYGAEQVPRNCHIVLKVYEEVETISFEVMDDGAGMSENELRNVKNFDFEPKGHGIGLKNIHERLNINYDNYDFSIESKLGHGTVVIIRIPKIGGDSECTV